MKKVKVEFVLSIGYASATHEGEQEFEFDDDLTQEEIENEIEEAWKEWMWGYIDGGWEIIE